MYGIKYIQLLKRRNAGTFQDAVWLLFAQTVA